MPLKNKYFHYNALSYSTNNSIYNQKSIYDIFKIRKKNPKFQKPFNLENIIQEQISKDNVKIGSGHPKKTNIKLFTFDNNTRKNNKSYDSVKMIKSYKNIVNIPKIFKKKNSNPNLFIKQKINNKKHTPSPSTSYYRNNNSIFKKKNNSSKYINNYSRNIRNLIIEKLSKEEEKTTKDKNKTLSSSVNYIRVNTIKMPNNTETNNFEISTDNSSKRIKTEIKKQKTENNIFLDKNYQKNRFQINKSKSFNSSNKIINDVFTNEKQKEYNNLIVKKKNITPINQKNDSNNNKSMSWVNRLYNNELKKNKVKQQLILRLRKSILKNNQKNTKLNKTENKINDINKRWLDDDNYLVEDYNFFNSLNTKIHYIDDYKINNYNKNEIAQNFNKKNNRLKIPNNKKTIYGKNAYKNRRINLFMYNNELINEEDEEKENEDNEI